MDGRIFFYNISRGIGGTIGNEDELHFFGRILLLHGIEDLLFNAVFLVESGYNKGNGGIKAF